jgi:aspartate 1-decarboxylase
MLLTLLKAKIHRAVVTGADLEYEGSITVDAALLEQSGILPYEQVDVLNINNGQRFTTYAITGERNSGIIAVNGAAARLVQKGDRVIICAYGHVEKEKARNYKPTVLLMNDDNTVKSER